MLTKDLSQEKVLLSKRDGLSQGHQAIVYSSSYQILNLMTLGIQLVALN